MIKHIHARTLLSSSKNPDPWFGIRYNMNLYRGCQHQCIYCDSRSDCYHIENFEDILIKENAIELLRKELTSKREKGTIGFGSMNDCYMPIEKKEKLTNKALKVIAEFRFPIHILTKSDLVLRDIDLIKSISDVYAAISFSITTADDELGKKVEPGASLVSKRFKAMKILADSGIYTGVVMMPILPYIEDNEENITQIVEKAAKAGAKYIIPAFGTTQRDGQREYYYQKLDELFPGLKRKYQRRYGDKYECNARNAYQLKQIFEKLYKRYEISTKIDIFKVQKLKQMGMGL